MNEPNTGALEDEAERIRADIAQTAEAIQDRMSPGKMVDEVMAYFKDSDGSVALDTLRRQVRDNPMALAMIGSGAAWLMFGGGSQPASRAHSDATARDRPMGQPFPDRTWETAAPVRENRTDGASAGGFADKAGAASERMREAAGDTADRMRGYRQDASAAGRQTADDVRGYVDQGRHTIMDALDREPLVLGAIGLAVGAAIGAMLPSTKFEDETFGGARDSLVKDAGRAVDRAAASAQHVAAEALAAARSASEDEGLTIEGQPVVERMGNVAKASIDAGERAATREIGASDRVDLGRSTDNPRTDRL